MATADDTFLDEDVDAGEEPEALQENDRPAGRASARRSLELYLEKKALRRRLQDTFSDAGNDLDELGW